MDNEDTSASVSHRIAELRAKKLASKPAPEPEADTDLVPDEPYQPNEEDKALDAALDKITVLDAYKNWCGKSKPKISRGQTESIKVSCPNPAHPDKNPSAWINSKKNLWHCAACDMGGDIYDIAAWHFGYPVPGYKSGELFHKLRRTMAEDRGYSFISAPGLKSPILVEPDTTGGSVPGDGERDENSDLEAVEETEEPSSLVELFGGDIDVIFPTLDWEEIVPVDTFLWHYMKATTIDDIAEEYHFWNALIAVGFAAGRSVTLFDHVPVLGNLFVCLLGHTGDGKSRSYSYLYRLLNQALPYNPDDEHSTGVEIVKTPGSAESLIHQFSKPVYDPTDPKRILYYAPVRGLIEFNELSGLTSRTARMGNALKPTLMDFYDGTSVISTSSMSTGKKTAAEPFGSAFTSTQPRALKDLIGKSDADSGFLNRWVFASGKPKERMAVGGIAVDITSSIPSLLALRSWASVDKEIPWTDEAIERFTEFYKGVVRPAQLQDQTGFLTRMDLLCKKLILLFCVNEMSNEVTKDIVDRVMRIYPYLVHAYDIPAAQIGLTPHQEIQDDIIRMAKTWQEKYKKGITIRELMRQLSRKKYPAKDINQIIKILVELDLFQVSKTATGSRGRPTVRYEYVG